MNTLRLSRGLQAVVDAADYARAAAWKWTALRTHSGHVYAVRRERLPDGSRRTVLLHRWLLDAPDGLDMDHVNGNGLDNRRDNLRLARRDQNTANSIVARGAVPLRGVSLDKRTGRFRASIKVRGFNRSIGYFDTAEEAAVAYQVERRKYLGGFAPGSSP